MITITSGVLFGLSIFDFQDTHRVYRVKSWLHVWRYGKSISTASALLLYHIKDNPWKAGRETMYLYTN